MKVFTAEKFVEVVVHDLTPVAKELCRHFEERGYETQRMQDDDGTWDVAITKGGAFRVATGNKTGLKIRLERRANGTLVRAGAGVFARQAIPGVISWVIWPPLLLMPVWGLIKQAGLDDEAVRVVELSLARTARMGIGEEGDAPGAAAVSSIPNAHAATAPVSPSAAPPEAGASSRYCVDCGEALAPQTRFCVRCGASVAAS